MDKRPISPLARLSPRTATIKGPPILLLARIQPEQKDFHHLPINNKPLADFPF